MEYKLQEDGKYKYLDVGEGEVLLLLHGLFGALSNWAAVIDHYKHNYRVIIPMLPIYGSILRRPTVDGLAKFVHQFVEHKQLENPVLLGNSLGGHVALLYALNHSKNYKALVLTGSSGLFEHAMGGSYPKLNNREYLKERIEYTFYDPKSATPELIDEVIAIVNDRLKVLQIISMSKSAMKHNLKEELHQIKKPVGLIWGKNDTITPPKVADEFNELIEDSTVYFIDKCGHAPMMEQPEDFNVHFDDFLVSLKERV